MSNYCTPCSGLHADGSPPCDERYDGNYDGPVVRNYYDENGELVATDTFTDARGRRFVGGEVQS